MDAFGFAEDDASFALPAPVAAQAADFKRTWEASLDAKAKAEDEAKKAMKTKAAEQLAEMKRKRAEKAEKANASNRLAEKELVEQIDADIAAGAANSWDRVVKMVDLTQADKEESDLARMRQIFIRKKNGAQ